ncbi:MAG: CCA tRNA nucleotidyltransferase [Candidatus Nanohalobium sp.]
MEWARVREKVIEQNYPDQKELHLAREVYDRIAAFIEGEYGLETHFAGSTSRGTCMSGDKDIDLFVLFPEDTERKELEQKGLTVGKRAFENFDGEYRVEYAEHPYTKGEIDDHEVEIVPCYDTDPENIKSAVDRTPHHSRWASKNLNEEQRKDAVILKKFLRSGGLYGSSLKVQSFSGYLCEIMIAYYGSFEELAEAAKNWTEEEFLDPENYHEAGLPEELKQKFSGEPLVVIDPVDPERNVASVMSSENYAKIIHRFWQFRQDPSMKFFQEQERDISQFEIKQEIDKRADFLVMEFERPDAVEDVIYPQMRKTLGRIEDALKKEDFRVFESGFHVGEQKTRVFFELEASLPEIREQKGPKVFHGIDHLEQFTEKYENTFIRGERIWAKVDREFTEAKAFINDFLSGDVEGLEQIGVPDHVAEKIVESRFTESAPEDEEWLKYLAEKLNVKENE